MNPPNPNSWKVRWWPRLSAILLVGVGLYFGFIAANTWGLSEQSGEATVVAKNYLPAGTTYRTINVGGRKMVQPVGTAEAWVLTLRLGDEEVIATVDKSLYDQLKPNDKVRATYSRTRFTKALRVVKVTSEAGKGGD